jgi:hypothetical protein
MPFTPKRPSALAHLSDEAASAVLAKHVGDIAKAARELGVDRKGLRRLIWHNPNILNAAHERMELFRIGVKSKILEAVGSSSARRRRWGLDALFDSYEFRDSLFASAKWFAPAQRERAPAVVDARLVLALEARAELARERDAELESDRRRERESAEQPATLVEVDPSVKFRKAPPAQAVSSWAGIRRPSRGGWR